MIKKLWKSPTLTTWASLGTQSLGLVLVLPLVLTRLSEEEITVYYLFATVIGLQALFQLGFQPTFVRLIGFAFAGRQIEDMGYILDAKATVNRGKERKNQKSLEAVCGSMRCVNRWLSLWTVLILGGLGTWLMVVPISRLDSQYEAWIGWGVIVLAGSIRICKSGYNTYLLGANYVALSQRWQALINIAKVLSMVISLLVCPSLVAVIIVNQTWIAMNTVCSWRLVRRVTDGKFEEWSSQPKEPSVVKMAWARSWRSALGQVGGVVTQQSLGIVYAQFSSGMSVVSYLLAIQLVTGIDQFSRAPFYSKLPLMNRLRAQGKETKLVQVSKRGMYWSYVVFVLGFGALAIFGPAFLLCIDSNVGFPDSLLWYLLGIAYFIQRFGANHIQLYSTTNRIIWHWANGLQGVVTILASVYLGPQYGVVGYAGSILLGSVFYAGYSSFFSYKIFKTSVSRYELDTSIKPLIVLIVLALLEWYYSTSEIMLKIFVLVVNVGT